MFPLPKSGNPPLLCYVTDRSLLVVEPIQGQKILRKKIAAAAAAGVDWIQVREKDLSGKELSTLAREAMKLAAANRAGGSPRVAASPPAQASHARILVNDRLDIALAADTGGVHLGEQSLLPQEALRLLKWLERKDFLIGVSCHSPTAAKEAERGGADYLFFGPVFATPSKAAYGAPQGLDRLGEVCRAVTLPVLAIGGITPENAAACLSAGASGIAAIRLFQDAADLARVVQTLNRMG
ncbi:MAG TPA: thiamine phosphate synthase, partial [Candidatus Sulfotelmatobacter sp.]|nr:thiamine phosphate synthase [Candidatus Sulfotelmatobacter sp.]